MDTLTEVDFTKVTGMATVALSVLMERHRETGPGFLARHILRQKLRPFYCGFLLVATRQPEEVKSSDSVEVGCPIADEQIRVWRSEISSMFHGIRDHGKSGYRSSWECRCPEWGIWRGGIVTSRGLYVATRGTGQEDYDEAMTLVVAALTGWEEYHYLRNIAQTSGNPHFEPIYRAASAHVDQPASA